VKYFKTTNMKSIWKKRFCWKFY